jgi:hypothetical protein
VRAATVIVSFGVRRRVRLNSKQSSPEMYTNSTSTVPASRLPTWLMSLFVFVTVMYVSAPRLLSKMG